MANFRKTTTAMLAAVTLASGMVVATPAQAHRHHGHGYGHHRDRDDDDRGRYNSYERNNGGGYYNDGYYRRSRCSNGNVGTIVGGVAGGLLGREVAYHRRDRTGATIIGAAVGALAGRAIEKSGNRC
jgi:hypothetical protein